jgi:AraC family transcriptional regulator, regulatory protein of adaptative response / methylated-DNA-[protein]-cysteine methyltransferase
MMGAMNAQMQTQIPDEETCWQAVSERDAAYNGSFVFGVRSTGIYCRPGCPARRPRRDQVVFFRDGSAAREAGFRACRRCKPDEPLHTADRWVEEARRILEQSEEPVPLAELARRVGASLYHLQRIFKAATGLTPRQYGAAQRMERLKSRLQTGQDVTTALYEAGFSSPSRLYEDARQKLGMTPGAYRNGGKGMRIRYTTFDTPLGRMLLAATEHGVCKISFGKDDNDLVRQLEDEFPQASGDRDEHGLGAWAECLNDYLEGRISQFDLPLDPHGTVFQQQVWAALRQIPYGETRTYAQIAQTIGQPTAVRAAAHAIASNPLAVVTPCHRVVRTDGGLGGYHWGMERKKALLKREHEGVEEGVR